MNERFNEINKKITQEVPDEKEPSTDEISEMSLDELKKLAQTLESRNKKLVMGCWINGCYIGDWDGETMPMDRCPLCSESSVILFIKRKSSPSEKKEK